MTELSPIYTTENCRVAYQLNWSLSIFPSNSIPASAKWLEPLGQATERDGIRILECREQAASLQFLLSTTPFVAPADVVRRVKGRLQHLVRDMAPKAFRRNYRIESVGEVNHSVLQDYVARQPQRHMMADQRLQGLIEDCQHHDPSVNLGQIRYSSHGQFIYNLQLVFENADHLHDISEETLRASCNMVVRASAKKGYLLSRIGILTNHIHLLVGCRMTESPISVGLGYLNNLAFALEMKPAFEFSFYAGTFTNYDRGAIRRMIASESDSTRDTGD